MKTKLLFLLLLASLSSFAQQYTLIPDVNFEKKLIALGLESGPADGKILTTKINTITILNLDYASIIDLTGIQDFVALKSLSCFTNQLTDVDISKNTALTYLFCASNKLTNLDTSKNPSLSYLSCGFNPLNSLDVTKNTALTDLACNSNQLSSLDVSKNTSLTYLSCNGNQFSSLDVTKNTALTDLACNSNQLSSLDVSNNTALKNLNCHVNQLSCLDVSKNSNLSSLYCYSNQLTDLNIKNGNNSKLVDFSFTNNPDLACIQVDDVTYSNTNWSTKKDATATFSENCQLGIADTVFETLSVYPNPTQGTLHIDNSPLENARVYDALGKLVKTKTFSGSNQNSIDLAGFPKGIYYIYLESQGATPVKKIVLE